MARAEKVLLCGGSLLMTGLEASLQNLPGLELQRIDARRELLSQSLAEHPPDVLIVEMGILEGDSILPLLKSFPRLTLVGLDPASERILMISLQHETPLTAADLMRLLREQAEARNNGGQSEGGSTDLQIKEEQGT